jgi:mono/diheme cytochrome c family protein
MVRLTLTLALTLAAPALADEVAVQLAPGQGRDTVAAHCTMCHSLDYIELNSPFLDRKGWEASVSKMINVMGAPIAKDDAAAIVDYLVQHYGKR